MEKCKYADVSKTIQEPSNRVMKQARTQETIYNPSFFATEANQQNGLLHEVKATLH